MANDDEDAPPEAGPSEPAREPPLPEESDRDRLTESIRQRLESIVPDLVRRTIQVGLGAVSQTEDSLRKVAKEVNLPSMAGYLASSADATKDKVLEVIARETREFLEHINLSEEIAKMLTTLSFEIKTEIRFIPNSERFSGAEPEVKASVRMKRAAESDDKGEGRRRFWRKEGRDSSRDLRKDAPPGDHPDEQDP